MGEVFAEKRRWWSQALLVGGVISILCLVVGALGSRLGLWDYLVGFFLLVCGIVLAAGIAFLGVIAAIICWRKGLVEDRSSVLIGLVLSTLVLVQAGVQLSAAAAVPPIHNISTDIQDPPEFSALVPIRAAENANPHTYDAAVLADIQREAYPGLETLSSLRSSEELMSLTQAVMRELGIEIVAVNTALGTVEGTATTFWFGFKDDVVVRIRESEGMRRVDIHSVSRVGTTDAGANARRIERILDGLR